MTPRAPTILHCPVPLDDADRVLLGHGSGGRLSAQLLARHFLPQFDNPALAALGDASVIATPAAELAVSTDSFVVHPVEFPGGNIGTLAVNGTLNDVAMMGARPICLTAGFVLEEGLSVAVLDRVIAEMARAARAAGVAIVAGDTKVVGRGQADGLYINTTGLGAVDPAFRPAPSRTQAGDAILISGPVARHGMAIMAAREGLALESAITSDTACLLPLVDALRPLGSAVHALRDPTRGGVASALNEIAAASRVEVEIVEGAVPVPGDVAAACEVLGLDPLFVANEGVMVVFVADNASDSALQIMRAHPLGAAAARIGRVRDAHPGMVAMRTALGSTRIVDLLPGDQLPRIC